MKTTIILVRHGQTEWNRVERFRGRADVPLNEAGLKQASLTGKRIASCWKPAAVYSSPLSRARDTALAAASHFGLPVKVHPGLADIDYGEWQGLTPEQVREKWPAALSAWYEAPQLAHIPGGENLAQLRQRVMEMLEGLVEAHSGETIILVGHTVLNRILLLGVLGLGHEAFWRLGQEPCAINIIEAGGNGYVLVSLNDTCHLKEFFEAQ